MADDAEIEGPHDWMALSSWQSTSAGMLRDTEPDGSNESELGIPLGSRGQGRWAVCAPTNTRAIGTVVTVELRKSPSGGLGFSITTRDNVEGPNSPIYIKHILPDGAAIKDGRLQSGDRLLQVNDVVMTGKCLSDVTAVLRNIKINTLTRIVISRQVLVQSEMKAIPKIMIDTDDSSEDVNFRKDALVSLHSESESTSSVPRINVDDCTQTLRLKVALDGSNQLGLRVKRSKTRNLFGLRVRSVIKGGLADKDGQLQVSDHLIEVNGISLASIDTSTAIDMFRSALLRSDENLGAIDITIIRWKVPETSPSNLKLTTGEENSGCLSICPILENAECDKRIISFSNTTMEAGAVEGFSMVCGMSSTGTHSCDFVPEEDVHLCCVKEQMLGFHELKKEKLDERQRILEEDKACERDVKRRFPDDNSTSAHSSSQSTAAVDQEKDEIDSNVAVFERQGFGRKSISEKRSSRELLSDSEVYRNIKENRKWKDLMKPEINAEFRDTTDCRGEELEFGEPATLGTDLQGSILDGSNPQGPLPNASIPLGTVPVASSRLGCLPNESTPLGSMPVQSVPLESVLLGSSSTRSIPVGSASQRSNPQGSAQNGSISLDSGLCGSIPDGSVLHGSVPLGSAPLRSVPLRSSSKGPIPQGSTLQQSVPHRSIQQGPLPHGPLPHGFIPHVSDPHGSVPCVSVPHGHVPPGSLPHRSAPDVVLNASTSRNIHTKQTTTDLSTTAVFGKNDSDVPMNSPSSVSSQVPTGTSSTPLSSPAKPSKKFSSLVRRFFKKGFTELFGSESQTESHQQVVGERNEGVVRHIPPNNPVRKDSSLPRLQNSRINANVSTGNSHPVLRQSYPNTLLTVAPNFYQTGQFPRHPTRFQILPSSARNSFPVQFCHPNPHPISTVLVRSHVSPIPASFVPCPTYVPFERAPIQACPIQTNRFPGPVVCPTRLWVGFGQKFVNIQPITCQESQMLNQ